MSSQVSKPNRIARDCKRAINLLLPLIMAAGCISAFAQNSSALQARGAISNKGKNMEVVVIDSLVVPEESKEIFLQRVRQSAEILKKLPGFVEGYVYEKKSGEGDVNIVTTAVWKDEEVLENAKKAIVTEFRKHGTNPAEIMKRLRVQASRSIYTRSPY
jgi:heme-degrading monooxygenase HmoA